MLKENNSNTDQFHIGGFQKMEARCEGKLGHFQVSNYGGIHRESTSNKNLSSKQSLLNSLQISANYAQDADNLKFRRFKPKSQEIIKPNLRTIFSYGRETQDWTATSEVSPKSAQTHLGEIKVVSESLISILEEVLSLNVDKKTKKIFNILNDSNLKEKPFCDDYLEQKGLSDFILAYANDSKEESLGLQAFIMECSEESLLVIRKILLSKVCLLDIHKYGSYVLQRLIIRDAYSMNFLSSYFNKNFLILMHNEFSSRIMQLLIECSASFRKTSINQLKANFSNALTSSPASHLIKACIKNVTNLEELSFILNKLEENPKMISNSIFRNVLIAYAQICSQSNLQKIALILRIETRFLFYLNSKSFTSIIFLLLERQEQVTTTTYLHHLQHTTSKFFSCRCHQLLFNMIGSLNKEKIALVNATGLALANLSEYIIYRLKKAQLLDVYLLSTLNMIKEGDVKIIDNFLGREIVCERKSSLIRGNSPAF